jgi:hypothetical protein
MGVILDEIRAKKQALQIIIRPSHLLNSALVFEPLSERAAVKAIFLGKAGKRPHQGRSYVRVVMDKQELAKS